VSSSDRGDDAERHAGSRERRALLDVQLDEARGWRIEPSRARQLAEPERGKRLGQRDAIGVAQIALVVVELSADRAAAEHAAAEARPLLEPKGDDRQSAVRHRSGADRLHGIERAEHTQCPVEAATVGRRVEMRSAPDLGQIRLAAGQPAHEVACRIARDLEARLAHPAGHELVGALLAGPESGPVGAGCHADLEERVEAVENTPGAPLGRDRARRARGVAAEPAHGAEYAARQVRPALDETRLSD
jgi:hypothetical protein